MFVVHTSVPIDPDRREEAMAVVSDLVEASRAEDGTVRYRATTDLTDPNVVGFFEQYEDVAAAEAHTGTAHYRRFVEALPDIADGEIETVQFETEEVETATFSAADVVESLD